MRKANELSRRLNWKVEIENYNENKKTDKKWICSLVEVVVEELKVNILEKIKKNKEKKIK